jgi:phytoene desaturase (3,4-didehydrolycopene-forming)
MKEVVREPAEWREMYSLEHGAAFGLSHGLNQLALFRPGCVDPEGPKGLYFVGASSRPGNGVPLVMMGAKLTVERILATEAGALQ